MSTTKMEEQLLCSNFGNGFLLRLISDAFVNEINCLLCLMQIRIILIKC